MKSTGKIIVRGDLERADADYIVDWQIRGENLNNTGGGFLGMCCKTVEGVQYALENGRMDHWKPAWMSEEVVGMGTNPTW